MPLATPVAISFEPKKIHRLHRANKRGGLTRSSPEMIQKKKAAVQWTSALHRSRCWFHSHRAAHGAETGRARVAPRTLEWYAESAVGISPGPFSQTNIGTDSALGAIVYGHSLERDNASGF
jgi:hypothetical protein